MLSRYVLLATVVFGLAAPTAIQAAAAFQASGDARSAADALDKARGIDREGIDSATLPAWEEVVRIQKEAADRQNEASKRMDRVTRNRAASGENQ